MLHEARGDWNLFKLWIEEIEMLTEYFDEHDFYESEKHPKCCSLILNVSTVIRGTLRIVFDSFSILDSVASTLNKQWMDTACTVSGLRCSLETYPQ